MSITLQTIWVFLRNQSMEICLLFIFLALLSRILKNRSAHLRYMLWMLLPIKCLIPGLFVINLPILDGQENLRVSSEHLVPLADPFYPFTDFDLNSDQSMANGLFSHLNSINSLVALWALGLFAFSIVIVVKCHRINQRLRQARSPLEKTSRLSLGSIAKSFGISKPPQVWLTDHHGQPFVWGIWRGGVYIPKEMTERLDQDSARLALAHEFAHVTRKDVLLNTFQLVIQALFWFHPAIWLANARIRREREKCCDEMAIARLSSTPKEYSKAILANLENARQAIQSEPVLGIASHLKDLEERIRTMMKKNKSFYPRAGIGALFFVATMGAPIIFFSFSLSAEETEHAQDLSASSKIGSGQTKETMPSLWPTRPWISQPFGNSVDPSGKPRFHSGMDIVNRQGQPVVATAPGSVQFAGSKGKHGNLVVLDHGHGTITRYSHLDQILVQSDQKFDRGDILGTVGNSGVSTKPHLHYEVEIDGKHRDPMKYVRPKGSPKHMPCIWPTYAAIASAYGQRLNPYTKKHEFHRGVDIINRAGAPVVASAKGRILFAGEKGAKGLMVSIDHGDGLKTVYTHLGQLSVQTGQQVKKGEKIASIGSTGKSTGPHLHYEVWLNGKTVDPMEYMRD